jgi:hypothetical protein
MQAVPVLAVLERMQQTFSMEWSMFAQMDNTQRLQVSYHRYTNSHFLRAVADFPIIHTGNQFAHWRRLLRRQRPKS